MPEEAPDNVAASLTRVLKDLDQTKEIFGLLYVPLRDVASATLDLNKKVDKGFEQVDRRFDQVDRRFEQVDGHFEQVDRKLHLIDATVGLVRDDVRAVKAQIERLAGHIITDELKN